MVRRIIWTSQAETIFTQILQFYIDRNGSKSYSRKILAEVKGILNVIKKQPFLGSTTEVRNVRVIVTRKYRLFYQVETSNIVVLLIRENQANPEDLSKLLI